MTIAKKCIGCHSNKKQQGIQYYQCKSYFGLYRDSIIQDKFRDEYCPCVNCLVKVTCTDPKMKRFKYTIGGQLNINKCNIFKQQMTNFYVSFIKQFLIEKEASKERIKMIRWV